MTFNPDTFTLHDDAMRAIDAGALVVDNNSGGKDSSGQSLLLAKIVPPFQRLTVHATLGEFEWAGALDKAEEHAQRQGVDFRVVESHHNFLTMVLDRYAKRPDAPCWPSPKYRLCTSTLKTAPIEKVIRAYARERGFTTVINCLGLRAEESKNRASKPACVTVPHLGTKDKVAKDGSVEKGRTWMTVLPIHHLKTDEVFGVISDGMFAPHYAYGLGNERVSCSLCFFGSKCDLRRGATHNEHVYQKFAALEVLTGWAYHPSRKTLPELTGIPVNEEVVEAYRFRMYALAKPGPLPELQREPRANTAI